VIEIDALLGVQLLGRFRDFLGQPRIVEMVPPGDDLHRAVVAVVGVGAKAWAFEFGSK